MSAQAQREYPQLVGRSGRISAGGQESCCTVVRSEPGRILVSVTQPLRAYDAAVRVSIPGGGVVLLRGRVRTLSGNHYWLRVEHEHEERRSNARVALDRILVEVETPAAGRAWTGVALDISVAGIRTSHIEEIPVRTGDRTQLVLTLDDVHYELEALCVGDEGRQRRYEFHLHSNEERTALSTFVLLETGRRAAWTKNTP